MSILIFLEASGKLWDRWRKQMKMHCFLLMMAEFPTKEKTVLPAWQVLKHQ
jgi:hypothetical protein